MNSSWRESNLPMVLQIVSFFRRCNIDDAKDLGYHLPFWKKLLRVIQIFALFFPLSVVFASLVAGFVSSGIQVAPVDDGYTRLSEVEKGTYQVVSIGEAMQTFLTLAVLGVIAAPVFEELIFRSPLRFRWRWVFGIGGWFISQRLMDIPAYRSFWLSFESSYPLLVHVIVPLAVPLLLIASGIGIGDIFTKKFSTLQAYEHRIGTFIKSRRSIVVILSSLAFGFIHITKFMLSPDGSVSISPAAIAFFPLLLLPQIIAGFEFAFVRLKYGLLMAICSHALANAFAALPGAFIALTQVVPQEAIDIFLREQKLPDGVSPFTMNIALIGSIVPSIIVFIIIGFVVIGWVYSFFEYVRYRREVSKK